MQASYLGYEDGPKSVRHADIRFPRGVFVTVPEGVAKKLGTNRFFAVKEGEAPPLPDEPEELTAVPTVADGGSDEDRTSVLAKLDALAAKHPEVTFDRRLGVAKLRAILEEAEFEHGED